MMIVSEANTMNIIKEHNWLGAQLALASVIIDDKWHQNLECHLLETLEAAFKIAIFYNTGPRSKLKLPIFLLQLLSQTRQLGQANVPSLTANIFAATTSKANTDNKRCSEPH